MVATALKALWAKSRSRTRVAAILALIAVLGALRSVQRRRAFSWDGKQFADPTYGRTIPGMVYDPHDEKAEETTWEVFLNALNIPATSPLSGHIRQLFARPDIDEQLQKLFVQLVGPEPHALSGHVATMSKGLSGSIRCFAAEPKRAESVPLAECTQEDAQWILAGFDHVYSEERPLNLEKFPSFVKLIIVRRILRTLISCFGLENLEQSISAPLVIDVIIDIGSDEEFRIHTVAPKCSSLHNTHSLAVIGEDPNAESLAMRQAMSPKAFGRSLSLRDEQELNKVDAAFRDVSMSRGRKPS